MCLISLEYNAVLCLIGTCLIGFVPCRCRCVLLWYACQRVKYVWYCDTPAMLVGLTPMVGVSNGLCCTPAILVRLTLMVRVSNGCVNGWLPFIIAMVIFCNNHYTCSRRFCKTIQSNTVISHYNCHLGNWYYKYNGWWNGYMIFDTFYLIEMNKMIWSIKLRE